MAGPNAASPPPQASEAPAGETATRSAGPSRSHASEGGGSHKSKKRSKHGKGKKDKPHKHSRIVGKDASVDEGNTDAQAETGHDGPKQAGSGQRREDRDHGRRRKRDRRSSDLGPLAHETTRPSSSSGEDIDPRPSYTEDNPRPKKRLRQDKDVKDKAPGEHRRGSKSKDQGQRKGKDKITLPASSESTSLPGMTASGPHLAATSGEGTARVSVPPSSSLSSSIPASTFGLSLGSAAGHTGFSIPGQLPAPPLPSSAQLHAEVTQRIAQLEKQVSAYESVSTIQTRLLDGIQEDVMCDICCAPLWRPYTLVPCGHIFCLGCLVQWFEQSLPPPWDRPSSDTEHWREMQPNPQGNTHANAHGNAQGNALFTSTQQQASFDAQSELLQSRDRRRLTKYRQDSYKYCPRCRVRLTAAPVETFAPKSITERLDTGGTELRLLAQKYYGQLPHVPDWGNGLGTYALPEHGEGSGTFEHSATGSAPKSGPEPGTLAQSEMRLENQPGTQPGEHISLGTDRKPYLGAISNMHTPSDTHTGPVVGRVLTASERDEQAGLTRRLQEATALSQGPTQGVFWDLFASAGPQMCPMSFDEEDRVWRCLFCHSEVFEWECQGCGHLFTRDDLPQLNPWLAGDAGAEWMRTDPPVSGSSVDFASRLNDLLDDIRGDRSTGAGEGAGVATYPGDPDEAGPLSLEYMGHLRWLFLHTPANSPSMQYIKRIIEQHTASFVTRARPEPGFMTAVNGGPMRWPDENNATPTETESDADDWAVGEEDASDVDSAGNLAGFIDADSEGEGEGGSDWGPDSSVEEISDEDRRSEREAEDGSDLRSGSASGSDSNADAGMQPITAAGADGREGRNIRSRTGELGRRPGTLADGHSSSELRARSRYRDQTQNLVPGHEQEQEPHSRALSVALFPGETPGNVEQGCARAETRSEDDHEENEHERGTPERRFARPRRGRATRILDSDEE